MCGCYLEPLGQEGSSWHAAAASEVEDRIIIFQEWHDFGQPTLISRPRLALAGMILRGSFASVVSILVRDAVVAVANDPFRIDLRYRRRGSPGRGPGPRSTLP